MADSSRLATAHGAGLMIAPALLGVMSMESSGHLPVGPGVGAGMAVGLHTLSMFVTMAAVAWIVYRKLGLMVLRKSWVNFDLIWAAALLIVGSISFVVSI